jgi:hypothetical protein
VLSWIRQARSRLPWRDAVHEEPRIFVLEF